MIIVSELTFQYEGGDGNVLKSISLKVPTGGFLGIIGPSGAGKTTLLHAMNGIIPHHSKGTYYGSVSVDGTDTFDGSLTDLSLMVGTVFQDIESQLLSAVVEDELLYGLENFGVPREEIETRIRDTLDSVGITGLRHRRISTLSGGQKQKVALASVLALRPKLLLLDEPTAELDPKSSRQIYALLRELNARHGMTVVVVEQKIMLLGEFASELAVLSAGRLAFHGPVRSVLAHSEELEALGVNCPRVVTLWSTMRAGGLTDSEICLNVDEAEKTVRRALA